MKDRPELHRQGCRRTRFSKKYDSERCPRCSAPTKMFCSFCKAQVWSNPRHICYTDTPHPVAFSEAE